MKFSIPIVALALVWIAAALVVLPSPDGRSDVMPAEAVQASTNRIQWNGSDWFMSGANLPWYHWGCDFGCDGLGVASNPAIETAFADASANGIHTIRWWVFPGNPWQLDNVTGTYADFDRVLQLAKQYDLYLVFTLFSSPADAPIWDPTGAVSKLRPLFQRYGNSQRIVAWDVVNEPEWQMWDGTVDTGQTVTFVNAIADAVHQYTQSNVTVGSAMVDGLDMWLNSPLDYYTVHWYDYMQPGVWCAYCRTAADIQAQFGISKPIVIGEWYANTEVPGRWDHWYDSGYAGALAWALLPDRTLSPDLIIDRQYARAFANSHSDDGPVEGTAPTPMPSPTPTPVPYGVTWGAGTAPTSIVGGSLNGITVSLSNAGSLTWSNGGSNPVRFAYHWRNGSCPGTSTAVWDGKRTNLGGDVAPGGAVTNFAAQVIAPFNAGTYCLVYDLVRESVTWFSWQGAQTKSTTVTVTTPAYGVTWGSQSTPASLAANSSSNISVSFTNTGTLTWSPSGANPVRLAYHWLNGACAGGSIAVWDGARTTLPGSITTGNGVTNLSAKVVAPSAPGSYCLVYDLVREGVTWFSWQGAWTKAVDVAVTASSYGVAWTAGTTPSSMTVGATGTATLTFSNTGALTWSNAGTNPVHVSYHWRNGSCVSGGSTAVWDGLRTALPDNLASGASVTGLAVQVRAPSSPGTYCLVFDLVREGITWFSWQGAGVSTRTVTVVAP